MIPQLSKALSSGFTSKQIMDFILKKFPQHRGVIQNALTSGFTAEQVLKYLAGGKKALSIPEESAPQGATEFQQMRNRDISRREDVNKKGIQAAGLVGAGLAAPMATAALQHALPNSLKPMTAPLTTALQQQTQQSQSQQPPTQNVNNVTSVTQPSPNVQSEGIPINPQQSRQETDALWQRIQKGVIKHPDKDLNAFLKIANDLTKFSGLDREGFDKLYDEFIQKKQAGVPLDQIAKDMFAMSGETENKLPHDVPEEKTEDDKLGFKAAFATMGGGAVSNKLYEGIFDALKNGKDTFAGVKDPLLQAAKPAFDAGQIKSVEDLKKFADFYEKSKQQKPIAKNETVASPHGVGEVKEIRNGQAIIEVDGKLHKVKEDELEGSPIPEKDLADLYDELIQGIESETGEDVSRMVQWAGYNPETNTLQFLPHTGKLYKYGNISPDDAALLTDILSTRKTSGENFIGVWKKDSKSPIGAALSKLIRKLQAERGGKGNEYEETHEPIYSAYEPAIQAKKKKKKK